MIINRENLKPKNKNQDIIQYRKKLEMLKKHIINKTITGEERIIILIMKILIIMIQDQETTIILHIIKIIITNHNQEIINMTLIIKIERITDIMIIEIIIREITIIRIIIREIIFIEIIIKETIIIENLTKEIIIKENLTKEITIKEIIIKVIIDILLMTIKLHTTILKDNLINLDMNNVYPIRITKTDIDSHTTIMINQREDIKNIHQVLIEIMVIFILSTKLHKTKIIKTIIDKDIKEVQNIITKILKRVRITTIKNLMNKRKRNITLPRDLIINPKNMKRSKIIIIKRIINIENII